MYLTNKFGFLRISSYASFSELLNRTPPVQEDAILGRVVAAESERGRLDFSEPHWRVLNQLLGGLSRWEAVVVGTGRHLKSRTEPGDLPRSSPDKGGAGTIQVLMWITPGCNAVSNPCMDTQRLHPMAVHTPSSCAVTQGRQGSDHVGLES